MKVYVVRTSGSWFEGEVREYRDMKECIDEILEKEDFGKFEPGIIVYKTGDMDPENARKCEYMVEIYDDWRE